jgi:hypothetical protein
MAPRFAIGIAHGAGGNTLRHAILVIALVVGVAACEPAPTAPTPKPIATNAPTPRPTPTPTCAYSANNGSSSPIAAAGGQFTIDVTTTATCAWTSTSEASFITHAGATGATGSGSVTFTVTANAGASREGSVTVAGHPITILQEGTGPAPCTFTVSPLLITAPAAASSSVVTIVMTSGTNCPWSASTTSPFLSFTGATSGSGSGAVTIVVAQNTGSARSGFAIVAGQTVNVNQAAASLGTGRVARLSIQSDPGDFIGQGTTASYTMTSSQFTATIDGARAELDFRMEPIGQWRLRMEAPAGQQLLAGMYDTTARWPFQLSSQPGLDFSGFGRGCNRSTGRFFVGEASYAPDNSVTRFHAIFDQHCEGWSVKLRGEIWIDANGTAPLAIAPMPAPTTPVTLFSFVSDPGDFVGGGQSRSFSMPAYKFMAWAHDTDPAVNISMQSVSAPVLAWNLDFEAPSGVRLQPGTYTGATRYPFNSAGVPGLSVTGGGAGCNTLTGSFIVLEAVYGPRGEVLRFHATFEQHCEGATPALRGEIRIVADPWR